MLGKAEAEAKAKRSTVGHLAIITQTVKYRTESEENGIDKQGAQKWSMDWISPVATSCWVVEIFLSLLFDGKEKESERLPRCFELEEAKGSNYSLDNHPTKLMLPSL